ncbi:MAG TPA: beta-propeller domain-containing protein [Acidimicrobiia bacterium]|nr:beta-propeller domain-containing protein [Acidimicrobiia bacterium]
MWRKTLPSLVGMAFVVGACTSAGAALDKLPDGTLPAPKSVRAAGALVQFEECDVFLDYVITHGVELVGPYGLGGDMWAFPMGRAITDTTAAAAEESAQGGGSDGEFSGTNVQVEGVDEPDMVKTDGERIVLLAEGDLIVVDVTGPEPVEVGRLAIGDLSVQNLFLSGDRVLLFGSVWSAVPIPFSEDRMIAPVPDTPTIRIVEVDISSDPELVRTMSIDGAFVSGRMVDDSVRLVLSSGPVGFEWSYPTGSGLRAEREAIEENQQIIRDSSPDNWIPYYLVTDADGNVIDEGTLFDCERAGHPEEFSGLDMLSVVTIDLASGIQVVDATGVLATGDIVYSSEQNLYVATQRWSDWRWLETGEVSERPEGPTTEIHMFDVSSADISEYVASGSVDGYLLNQFSMDEHNGVLRVATTTSPNGWGADAESESKITVLRPGDASLAKIGEVGGLGKSEQIYSVRFMGDVGYVVTFRQTDPLYTIDLSDPSAPAMVGELKIPGYSAYLHPVGEGLVMGVGQDATDTGQVLGTQVSIFDVSDLANPQRVDTFTLSEGTNSQVEYDHHAFLYWKGLTVIPVQKYWWDEEKEEMFMGAIALRVAESGELEDLGEIIHPGGEDPNWNGQSQILRSAVIGDALYTISADGVLKSDLVSLDDLAWLDL